MDKKNFTILLLSTVIAAFLGAFAASWYFHTNFEHSYNPMMRPISRGFDKSFNNVEKMIERQQDVFDEDIDNGLENDMDDMVEHAPMSLNFAYMSNNGLKTSETNDAYKVTVDLKPFNSDEKNIDMKVKGNSLYISAKYKSKGQHEFHSSQFYQVLHLPKDANVKGINQQKEGDFLVINIPKK